MKQTPFIIQDAFFGTINNLGHNCIPDKLISDLIINTLKDGKFRFNIHNISNLYVLVGFKDSERYIKKDELTFKKMLNNKQYRYFNKHKRIILGIMEVNQSKIRPETNYIDWIDTFVPKYNIASFIMEKYRNITKNELIPREFITHSIKYWMKNQCWDAYEDYDNHKEIIIKELELNEIKDEINYDVLYKKIEENKKKEEVILNSYDNSDVLNTIFKKISYYSLHNKISMYDNFYFKKRLNILKKILKNKRNLDIEELCKEAFKPKRLFNRIQLYGDNYEFI
jgi:hypothetical protein